MDPEKGEPSEHPDDQAVRVVGRVSMAIETGAMGLGDRDLIAMMAVKG